MNIVLDEIKRAEEILKHGEIGSKPTATLFLLAKYYRHKENLTRKQTFEKLDDFMQCHYPNYSSALWEDKIEQISKKAEKYLLHEISSISITQKELDQIMALKNLKYEKLLFSMLCSAKFYNEVSEKNNNWVNSGIPELFKTAGVTVKHKNDKFLYLNDLHETGLISFSARNDNLNIKINFIDATAIPVLEISDFRELGYEYLHYLGKGIFIRCTECSRLVLKKSKKDFSTKYCKECAKAKKREQNRISYQKKR